MIYTIGYQKMKTSEALFSALKERNVTYLLDVRSKPFSRNPYFTKTNLKKAAKRHGIEYRWVGNCLGGFSEIKEETIKALAAWSSDWTGCLLCMEADPDKCHRKTEIAFRLEKYGIAVDHIVLI